MEGQRRGYLSYLLRLWQAASGGEVVWRASLQRPHSTEPMAFPTLEALFTFLRKQTGVASDSDGVDKCLTADSKTQGGRPSS
jgi:hypothetical protein